MMMPGHIVMGLATYQAATTFAGYPLQPWLMLAVALLFVAERVLATRPGRSLPA
mgnify:CR=1 FL=1